MSKKKKPPQTEDFERAWFDLWISGWSMKKIGWLFGWTTEAVESAIRCEWQRRIEETK